MAIIPYQVGIHTFSLYLDPFPTTIIALLQRLEAPKYLTEEVEFAFSGMVNKPFSVGSRRTMRGANPTEGASIRNWKNKYFTVSVRSRTKVVEPPVME